VSRTFTKLFSSITESTVWCEPHATVRVWIAMLAKADHAGRVFASIPGLANLARVGIEECDAAIITFLSPDKYSRTPDFEGRRIEPVDGGWRLLNYAKYRAIRDEESVKESKRRYINQRRAEERAAADAASQGVEKSRTESNAVGRGRGNAEGEEEAERSKAKAKAGAADAKRAHRLPDGWEPSESDIAFAEGERVNWRREAASFRDYWHSKAGRDATKTDWSATWRNWVRRAAKTTGPTQAPVKSKTLSAVETALRIANGQSVDGAGNRDGDRQASLLEAPRSAGRRHDGWDDRGMG